MFFEANTFLFHLMCAQKSKILKTMRHRAKKRKKMVTLVARILKFKYTVVVIVCTFTVVIMKCKVSMVELKKMWEFNLVIKELFHSFRYVWNLFGKWKTYVFLSFSLFCCRHFFRQPTFEKLITITQSYCIYNIRNKSRVWICQRT